MQPATAEKVDVRWQCMNLQSNCVISSWEWSGQGDGDFIAKDDIFAEKEESKEEEERAEEEDVVYKLGCIKSRPRRALDQQNIL